MEFESLEQHELVISILQQIKKAILDLQEWNNDVVSLMVIITIRQVCKN
ncbi:MAG: hypothetical protein J6X18_10255 [Bacteroidales bacterium]|nr:hypothetical protein [Bacteroidales bacterium]